MTIELLSRSIVLFAANYLLHSTLIIAGVALLCRLIRDLPPRVVVLAWRFALLIPLVTTFAQTLWLSNHLETWNLSQVGSKSTIETIETSAPDKDSLSLLADSHDLDDLQQSSLDDFIIKNESLQEDFPADSLITWDTEPERWDSNEQVLTELETFPLQEPVQQEAIEPTGSSVFETSELPHELTEQFLPVDSPQDQASQVETLSLEISQADVEPTNWFTWIAIPILVGWGIAVVAVLFRTVRMWHLMKSFPQIEEGPIRKFLDRLIAQSNVRFSVQVFAAPSKTEPAACGILYPKIIVPDDLSDHLSNAEIEALLAHELGHLVARDPLWGWVGQFIVTAFFWQPLNLLALRRWRTASERQCDGWAITVGIEPITLAKCLTNVASWKTAPVVPHMATATSSPLSDRVERLLNWRKNTPTNRFWRCVGYVLLFALVPSVLYGVPRIVWNDVDSEIAEPLSEPESISPHSEDRASLLDNQTIEPSIPLESSSVPLLDPQPVESDTLIAEFSELSHDLSYALELLSQQESDPEIDAAITSIELRLAEIHNRLNSQHDQFQSTTTRPSPNSNP